MTWGRGTDQHEAADQLRAFLDAGGTLIDTAAGYADGDSEQVLGVVLDQVLGTASARSRHRDGLVIASKAGVRRHGGARVVEVSRRGLLADLDDSLRRLGLAHLDLWQIHAWSADTPLDETLSACAHALSTGRVRYVGICNYRGWQTALAAARFETVTTAAGLFGSGLVSTQVEYSLLRRRVEDEVLPAAAALGLGVLPYSPLGRGVLTGKYRHGTPADAHAADGENRSPQRAYLTARSRAIVDAVCRAADGLELTPAEVALAWLRDRPGVTAPIVGARTAAQLRDSLGVERVELPPTIAAALAEVSAEPCSAEPASPTNPLHPPIDTDE